MAKFNLNNLFTFILGPSGCGKYIALTSYLNQNKIEHELKDYRYM